MKTRWTETEIVALPPGEHDFFDRKSGALLDDPNFRKDMGKAISAFANSGGGHLLIGVKDDGSFDGVNPVKKGRTSTRDWLEQTIPNLVVFPLQQFRIHQVEPSNPSNIPAGKVLIVVDVGDSTLAPHQVADSKIYYYRQAGRSEHAPHFYLETLRNRLISPVLTAELTEFQATSSWQTENGIFVRSRLKFVIKNIGGVAAYKWNLVIEDISGFQGSRDVDYIFDPAKFPPRPGTPGIHPSSIPFDTTILPSLSYFDFREFGFYLDAAGNRMDELHRAIPDSLELHYRVVTEVSPGEGVSTRLASLIDKLKLKNLIEGWLGRRSLPL